MKYISQQSTELGKYRYRIFDMFATTGFGRFHFIFTCLCFRQKRSSKVFFPPGFCLLKESDFDIAAREDIYFVTLHLPTDSPSSAPFCWLPVGGLVNCNEVVSRRVESHQALFVV